MLIEICMVTDDNYCQQLGVCLISILENNENNEFNVHILNNNISLQNLKKLNKINEKYNNITLYFYDLKKFFEKKQVNLIFEENLNGTEFYDILGISAYARLFIADILPSHISKILYLDCDLIILDKINELYQINLENYSCAGCVGSNMARFFYLGKHDSPFINSGVLLINLDKWRKYKISELAIDLINSYPNKNFLHDQNIINILLNEKIKIINSKYNVSSQSYYVNYTKTLKINSYFGSIDKFPSKEEMDYSLKNPIIVHFLSQMWDRPWIIENTYWNHQIKNPFNKKYLYYKELSPWKNEPLKISNKKFIVKCYYEFIRFIMIYSPTFLIALLYYIKFKIKP